MKLGLALFSLLALANLAPGQTPRCQGFNDQTNTTSNAITAAALSGPTTRAYRFLASCTQPLRSARLFTSAPNRSFATSYEIWSENSATQLPLARLGGGTCVLPLAQPTAWYGVNFDAAVPVTANAPYWFVWIDPGFLQTPYEPGGVDLLPTVRLSGANWIAETPRELKLQLFDVLLDDFSVSTQPDACASSQGKLGTIFTNELPARGNANFVLEGTGFTPGAPAVLFLGIIPSFGQVPLPGTNGCFLHNELTASLSTSVFTGVLRSTTPSGNLLLPFPIPNFPPLQGQVVTAFFAVVDAGSALPLPVVTSNGLQLVVI
ncbi:MAG: hypothetical protein JNM84_26505 [Planctomycetes bacterium]|nr:hypothetical protein [Planctomycetota bacterium]